jgi:hypothetical protein
MRRFRCLCRALHVALFVDTERGGGKQARERAAGNNTPSFSFVRSQRVARARAGGELWTWLGA